MAQKINIGVRVDPELKAVLDTVAAADERTVSWLAEKVLREWAVKNGHLPPPKSKPGKPR